MINTSFDVRRGSFVKAAGETIIENDLFYIEISDGVTYNRNIENIVTAFFESIEETTGLRFYPEYHGGENDKIRIFLGDTSILSHPAGYSSYGNSEGAFINLAAISKNETLASQDYFYRELLHEMVHCLQLRNGYIPSRMFAEGHAELTARHIYRNYNPRYAPICFFSYSVKGELEKKIFSAKFEKYFSEMGYIYDVMGGSGIHSGGDIFGVYISKEFGVNYYSHLLRGFFELNLPGQSDVDSYEFGLYQAEFIRHIKHETSENVFADFVSWYWEYAAQCECDFC